jgi:hypothetical protein
MTMIMIIARSIARVGAVAPNGPRALEGKRPYQMAPSLTT